jgi:cytochrome c biogenesis protein CcmG/thiol:disulfide interchange protein DsbE
MDTSTTAKNVSSFQPRSARPMLLVVAIVVVGWGLLVAFFLYGERHPKVPQPPAIGRKLEQLQLQPLVGNAEPITAKNLPGKVVVLNFWGPWCTYCRVEMPHLAEIYERHKADKDFQFISVSCDANVSTENESDLQAETKSLLENRGFTFDVHRDHNGFSRQAILELTELGREGFPFPMTLILDRSAAVRGFFPGYAEGSTAAMAKLVEALLKEGETAN